MGKEIKIDREFAIALARSGKIRPSKALAAAVERVPEALWDLSEKELAARANLKDQHLQIKFGFWKAIYSSLLTGKPVQIRQIIEENLSYTGWWHDFLHSTYRVAWLLTPITELEVLIRLHAHQVSEAIDEILDRPLFDERGRISMDKARFLLRFQRTVEPILFGKNRGR